jgi:arylsulfatase A-like enzyme
MTAHAVHAAERSATPPNIVIFLADDQGWGDLSLNGNTNVRTPNIDSIGKSGAVFDRFYVCPVCAPTRAEFFTGRYHSRGGVRGVSTGLERLNVSEKTIGDTFKAAGYATGLFGKWHNGSQWPYHPNARGFDEFYGFTSGHWAEYFDALLEHNGQPVRGKGYVADDFTEHAMEFIAKNRAKPFFCYIPYNTPHSPFCVPDEYWNRWKDRAIGQRGHDGDKENLPITRCVMAMTENLDWNVGRVLRQLDELKLSGNTIVIYFSDNGPAVMTWNGGMKGKKGSTDEGGVRAPLFVRWPGKIKPGTQIPQIAGAIDLLPTLAHLTGVNRVGTLPLDGKDVSPLLFGTASNWPDRMIFSHQNGQVSVRTQRHRLDSRGALFDMVADPNQQKDISGEQGEVAKKLSDAVAAWRVDVFGAGAAAAVAKATPPAGKGKGKAGAKAAAMQSDARPYPVGYTEMPRAPLPARDGIPHGGVQRSANAPNSSFFTHWTKPDDSITWDIDVNQTGTYKVEVFYTCPASDVGSLVEMSCNHTRSTAKVSEAWDPPFRDQHDRVERSQSEMKEFRPLSFGSVRLEKGRGLLTLRALEIPGRQVMDVRLVTVTLEKPIR